MRAVLLVPSTDDEGLGEDRLRNGRFGLTNKPALTQQNIAGSLQASFKAGQNVTLGNLRSLNKKLQEAQKALDNANGNIDKSEETQDKIDDAVNEATDLLSSNIWERWWQGTLGKGREDSDKQLFALKYMEDEFNKLRAGEPGNPVISTGGIMSTAPLPRVAYWDPIFSINSHKIEADYNDQDLLFLPETLQIFLAISLRSSAISEKMRYVAISMNVLYGLLLLSTALLSTNPATATENYSSLITLLPMMLAMTAAIAATIVILNAINSAKYKELGGTTGRGLFYKSTAPSMFDNANWRMYVYINELSGTLISIMTSFLTTMITTSAAACILIEVGFALWSSSWQPTVAIGNALMKAGSFMIKKFVVLGMNTTYTPTVISCLLNIFCFEVSRNNDKSVDLIPRGLIEATKPPYKELSNTLWGQIGAFGQFIDDLAPNNGFNKAVISLTKFINIASLIAPILTTLSSNISKLANITHSLTEFTSNESRVAIIDPEFEDWFGMTRPNFSWNYNLKDYGSINAGSFPGESWDVSGTMEIKARVYPGFILDKNAASKVFQGKTITRSVILRQKFTTKNGFIYYGYMLLGEVSGKLYLVYERNCVYNASYRATTVRHAEQLIVNSGIFEGEPTAYFTYDRRGQLNYMYVDFEDGVRAQYRALKSAKENWLDGELINTEYDWNPYTVLTRSPSNGNTEGYINSYGDQ